jgi:predicted RNase H-like nuclease
MKAASKNVWLAGIDGCRDGWMVVFIRPHSRTVRTRVIKKFKDIVSAPERPAFIAVDIPIGLPNFSPRRGRIAEEEVRSLVKRRRSSVFRIPSRPAVYAGVDCRSIPNDNKRYKHACAVARRTSADKKAFAKQGFFLFPKIVEVDKLLCRHKILRRRVYETHPELTFWRLNGERAAAHPKSGQPGIQLRRRLLIAAGLPRDIVHASPPRGAKIDDLLDALACALIARRIRAKTATSFPARVPRDAHGLPMAIWA